MASRDSKYTKATLQLLCVTGSHRRTKKHVFRMNYAMCFSLPLFPDVPAIRDGDRCSALNLAGEAGRLGRQRFRRGELREDEDLPLHPGTHNMWFARLETAKSNRY